MKSLLVFLFLIVNAYVFAAPADKFSNSTAYAAPVDKFTISTGLLYENTDNVLLTQANAKKSENIYHALMSLAYKRDVSTLKANITLTADHADYQDNTFPDETTISSLVGLSATLSKQRLFWNLQNRYDRVQTNASSLGLPTNRENTNYFSTGPRFIFFLNNKHSLNADVRYQKFYTEKSDSDFSGYIISASYIRNITRTASVGISANYNNRKFDNTVLNTNYTTSDLVVRLEKKMKLSELGIDVGKTRINQELYKNTDEENIYRAFYNYTLGARTDLKLNYRREINDFSGLFSSDTTIAGGPILSNVNADIFLLEEGRLSVTRRFGVSSFSYAYDNYSKDYSNDALDLRTVSSSLSFSNKLSSSTSMSLSGAYLKTEYPSINRKDTRRIYSAGIVKTFLDKYDIEFRVRYLNNGSTNSIFIYKERRISLGGHYYF